MKVLHIRQVGARRDNLCPELGGEATWPQAATCIPCVRAYNESGDAGEEVHLECLCPDAFLDNGVPVDYCPRHGDPVEAAGFRARQAEFEGRAA